MHYWQAFLDFLAYPLFMLGQSPISLLGILKFLAVFWIGFFLGKLYRRRIERIDAKSINLTPENRAILSNLGYYTIVIGTIIVGLSALGINLTSLAFVAGAVSVGLGFGLQNIVSNFVSGIILMFEKSVRIGDLIELPSGERGRVREIKMRATTVTTFDNIDIIVPNSTFVTQNIINLTYQDDIRRLSIPFSAAYGSDVEQVKQTVLKNVVASSLIFERENKGRMPEVRLVALGQSSLDFLLVVYVTAGLEAATSYEFDFLPVIYNALNEAKINIPFPQLDVHVKAPPR